MNRPPRLAERLLGWTLPADDRAVVLGDLAEEFSARTRDAGVTAARRWYWRQCRRYLVSRLHVPPRPLSSRVVLADVMRDVHHAWRSLRSSPSFTVVALIVLTLGIGAATAIFSVVDAVVLRDLPVADSRHLMVVDQVRTDRHQTVSIAPQDYTDWNAQQDVFEGLAAWAGPATLTMEDGQPENVKALRATANLFAVLKAAPALGAVFSSTNETTGAEHVAVISDGLWRRRFGANPQVIGHTMRMDDQTWAIAGVMAPAFTFPVDRPVDVWIPYVIAETERVRGTNHRSYLQLIGRLRPEVTVEAARSRMTSISADLARQFPDWFKNRMTTVTPLRDTIIGADVRSWMLMLLTAVAFVLLIACVNVASLMLARASARGREMGVRAALGASRWRLLRSVIIESLMLSGTGTACGVLVAYWAVDALRASLPPNLPRSAAIALNWRVLLAATAAAVITGLVCAILPALQGSRLDLTRALREGGRAGSASAGRQRLRALLVAAEVGLAIILLVGAGLFMSSFVRLVSVDLGLDYHHVLTVGLTPRLQTPTREARAAALIRVASIVDAALPVIRSIPGVEHVAALSGTRPFEGGSDRTNVTVRGHEQDFSSPDDAADLYHVTGDYPPAIGVSLVRGQLFSAGENTANDAPVALLNETAAARFFPGVDPIGQTIGVEGARTVVGILRSVRAGGPEIGLRPEVYVPFAHSTAPFAYLVVRTTGDPAEMAARISGTIRSIAPDLPLSDVQTLEGFFGRLVAQRQFTMLIIGLFGVLALAIASAGIYGVMAYIVEQRTAEIGIRMALGARPGGVVGLVLRRAVGIVGAGLAAGLLIAWPLAQSLRAFLFQVQPHDVVVYAVAAFVLVGAGLVAALGPARRASRVDPIIALRAE